MKTIKSTYFLPAILTAMAITALLFNIYYNSTQVAMGSTIQGNDYQATSTAASSAYGAFTASRLIKTGPSSLGTVVITGAAAGGINIYDATTTDITLRANKSTSSILVASLPPSLVAGDYVFDIALSTGLYVDLLAGGTMPTTTISFR